MGNPVLYINGTTAVVMHLCQNITVNYNNAKLTFPNCVSTKLKLQLMRGSQMSIKDLSGMCK